jgi:membrane protein
MSATRAISDSIRRLLTSPEKELTRWQMVGRFAIELALHSARQLSASRAPQMAAALAYRTVFSIVPVFVLSMIILRMFYGDDAIAKPLNSILAFAGLDDVQVAGGAEDVAPLTAAEWVASIVKQISSLNFTAIGAVGIAVLVYAGISILLEIERSFNIIYRASSHRPLLARITRSWTVLTLGPIGLLASFYIGERFRIIVENVVGGQTLVALAGVFVTFVISWLLLLLAYLVVPSARVRLGPALLGSFFAAALWEAGKYGFRTYLEFATGYATFYGSLGLLPLFLLWVYITWWIVLFGLQVSQAVQTLEKGRRALRLRRHPEEQPLDPLFGMALLLDIARSFAKGEQRTPTDLATRAGVSEVAVHSMLERLREADIVTAVLEKGDAEVVGYTMARPAEAITAREAFRACAEGGDGDEAGVRLIREAQSGALEGKSLSDLLDAEKAE